ncbi:YetF domain-containing protein [Planosporangium thailandense]|uniref:YetF domain-containing protein n=1 Tax=Planosporangium thailandense TaxID=765197 RepID=UPI00197B5122
MQIPVLEKVLRTVLVYGGLALLLRVGGKRDLAQLNSFDLVVMLLLSNVVQNAIIGNDNSLSGGLIGAAVLVAINGVMVRVVNRHPRLTRIFEGAQTVLVRDGRVDHKALHRMGLRQADLAAALRRQGASDLHEVKKATIAPGGAIVVTLTDEAQDVTRRDLHNDHEALLNDIRTEIRAAVAGLEERLTDRLPQLPTKSPGAQHI